MRRALLYGVIGIVAAVMFTAAGCQPAQQPGVQAQAPPEAAPEKTPELEPKKVPTAESAAEPAGAKIQQLATALEYLEGKERQDAIAELAKIARDTSLSDEQRQAAVGVIVGQALRHSDLRPLVDEFASDPDPVLRAAVAASLVMAEPSDYVLNLLRRLSKDTDPGVRGEAVHALAQVEARVSSAEAIRNLVKLLGNPVGDASAKAAIQLIIKGGENWRRVLPYLEEAYTLQADARKRHAIILCAAMICAGTNPQQEKFARLARTTKQTKVRLHEAVLEGLPLMVKALKDPDPLVREIAAQGLGYLGDVRAAPALAKALSDPSPYVRRRAASALITVPAKPAQKALEHAALHDVDPTVRRYAVEALGWIEDDSVVPVLIQATKDLDANVRRYAAQELGKRRARQALDALIALFNDPDEDVRWQAVLAVGNLRDRRAVEHLVKALDDPAPQVAHAAERALQRLGIAKRKETHFR